MRHLKGDQSRQGDNTLAWSPRRLAAACGIIGTIFLLLYFGTPALFPKLSGLIYGGTPTTAQIVQVGAKYHVLLAIGSWLQGTGALLCVVFFLAVVEMAEASDSLAGRLVLLGSAVLVGVVCAEMVFTLSWAHAAVAGEASSAQAAYDLMARFIQVFPIVPASTVYLALAAALQAGRPVLAPIFTRLALGLGIAFFIVGLLGLFTPLAGAGSAALSGLQAVWIFMAAASLRRPRLSVATR